MYGLTGTSPVFNMYSRYDGKKVKHSTCHLSKYVLVTGTTIPDQAGGAYGSARWEGYMEGVEVPFQAGHIKSGKIVHWCHVRPGIIF